MNNAALINNKLGAVNLINFFIFLVPSARLELALPKGQGFSYHHNFRYNFRFCGLDYTFSILQELAV
tara:strand:+ start:372 stop:572 length:201 start_codon:yes stop_codon:yes gene_type:complete